MSHSHYFRDVSGLERVDVYRLLDLFGVTCPVAQHVVKKAIAAGQRGHKTLRRDWQDIADSARRKLEMIDEDVRGIEKAAGAGMASGGYVIARDLLARQRCIVCGGYHAQLLCLDMNPYAQPLRSSSLIKAQEDLASAPAAAITAEWPDESRRQDAAAEDVTIWPPEERIDAIGQNGPTAEHYTPPRRDLCNPRCAGCCNGCPVLA